MVGEISDDGQWVWDGANWIPVSSASITAEEMEDSETGRDVVSNTSTNLVEDDTKSAPMDEVFEGESEMNEYEEDQNNLTKHTIETHENLDQTVIHSEVPTHFQYAFIGTLISPSAIFAYILAISAYFLLGHKFAIPTPSGWAEDALYFETSAVLFFTGLYTLVDRIKRRSKEYLEFIAVENAAANNSEISRTSAIVEHYSESMGVRIERKAADKWYEDQPLPEIIYNPELDQNLQNAIDKLNMFSKTQSEFPSSISLENFDEDSRKLLSDLWLSLVEEINNAKKQENREIIEGIIGFILVAIVIVVGIAVIYSS